MTRRALILPQRRPNCSGSVSLLRLRLHLHLRLRLLLRLPLPLRLLLPLPLRLPLRLPLPLRLLLLLPLFLTFSGCYKDEVDLPALTTNPFDVDYTGPSVFVFDSTYVATIQVGIPPAPALVQIVQLHLRADLLPAGAVSSVRFKDPEANDPVIVSPVPNTYIYRFQRNVVEPFVERCYSVALWNGFSEARAETICCTLQ